MAKLWTPPRNWTTGETVTVEMLNQQISGNLNAVYHKFAIQSADLAKLNTTFSDLPSMSFSFKGGERYFWWAAIFYNTTNTASNAKFTAVVKDVSGDVLTTATGKFGLWGNGVPVSIGWENTFGNKVDLVTPTTLEAVAFLSGNTFCLYDGLILLQAAQDTAAGTLTLRQNSFLVAFRVDQ